MSQPQSRRDTEQIKLCGSVSLWQNRTVKIDSQKLIALLTKSGEIIGGANVESASYGLTCCAERVALFKALTDGKKHFVAVAVVARCDGGPMPCGACRQLLAEYAPDAKVFVADSDDLKTIQAFTVRRLLPAAFVLVP